MWGASTVLFLHFVGKKPKEKKVNRVTQQAAEQPEISLLLLLLFKN